MILLALHFGLLNGQVDEGTMKRVTNGPKDTSALIEKALGDHDKIREYAYEHFKVDDMYFIGRGLDYYTCLEGSLKAKEISYIHSDAYAAGELKHGTISLIVEGTPVVALATQDSVYEKTISNVKEVKTRGGRVILLCKQDAKVPADAADHVVRLPEFEGVFMPLLLIVPLQLFAYYMSVLRGCDVDKPRNLAKSVTVE